MSIIAIDRIDTGELGKLVFGYKSSKTREKVRRRLPALKKIMALHRNELLVIEYSGAYGGARAVKCYDRTSATDEQAMLLMLKRMEEQKDKMLAFYKAVCGFYLVPTMQWRRLSSGYCHNSDNIRPASPAMTRALED